MIKALGIRCIIARSFARIFFRNSINNGLLLIEQPDLRDAVEEGDTITVTVNQDIEHKGARYPIAALPDNLVTSSLMLNLVEIIQAGGLVKAMQKRNGRN